MGTIERLARICFSAMACLVLAAALGNWPAFADPDSQALKPMAPQIDPNADQARRTTPHKPLQASIHHDEQLGKPARKPMRSAISKFSGAGRQPRLAPSDQFKARTDDSNLAAQAQSGYGIIGVKFLLVAGRPPIINRVFPGTPADKVGLQTEDAIVAVDGVPTIGLTKEEVYDLIIGSPGTSVSISIMRGGGFEVVNCTRMDINDLSDPIVRRDYMLNM